MKEKEEFLEADTFGELLKKTRNKNKLTASQCGDIFGFDRRTILYHEGPELRPISMDLLVQMNNTLGLDFFQSLLLRGFKFNFLKIDWLLLTSKNINYQGYIIDKEKLLSNLKEAGYEVENSYPHWKNYSEYIKSKRLALALTQSQVGQKIGCSYQGISRLEKDLKALITIDLVYDLTQALYLDFVEEISIFTPAMSYLNLDYLMKVTQKISIGDTFISATELKKYIKKSTK